jgi:hypothetical protein
MENRIEQAVDEMMLRRAFGEFLEMPGLRITARQAKRLWGFDEHTCLRLLEFLVDARFLARSRDGLYARLTEGYAECPALPRTAGYRRRANRPRGLVAGLLR